ncbi:MAG: hypothetical protein JF588_01075 [Caulobacterales bacterium]|nr:hypothetical protein [Caulobacterales bacterium]
MYSHEMLWGLGLVVLALALAWGLLQNRRRNRANDRITEEATREQYSNPADYPETRERLKDQIRPS